MKRTKKSSLVPCLVVALAAFVAAGCSPGTPAEPAAVACPDFQGTWTSAPYDAVSMDVDGTHVEIEGLSMTLEIEGQEGCRVHGHHTWGNGTVGGTEHLVGVIDPAGTISLHEVGDYPDQGTNGRMWVTRVDDDLLKLSYLGVTNDGGRGNAFATQLARGTEAPEPLVCEDINGAWQSDDAQIMVHGADGSVEQAEVASYQLEVTEQVGCAFKGTNTWWIGGATDTEWLVGVEQGQDGDIIFKDVSPDPENRLTNGWGFARHVEGGALDTHYVGFSEFGDFGHSLTARLWPADAGSAGTIACPDVTGHWESGPFQVTRVHEDGSVIMIDRLARDLVISGQDGCTLSGSNRWQDSDETWHEERFTGVMNAARGELLLYEFGPHPEPGSTALIVERLEGDDKLVTSYLGMGGDGSYVSAIDTVLTRTGDAP